MRVGSAGATTRRLIAAIAIAAFALRALIPIGFMPAPGRLFALELCPDGLPSGMLAAAMPEMARMGAMPAAAEIAGMPAMGAVPEMADMPGMPHDPGSRHPGQIEHCVFGGASAHALVAHLPALGLLFSVHFLPAARFTPQRTGWHLLRIPLPRGPPAIA